MEGLKISGGDHDGGIDGEIELTDKLGFKETIYIQSKNWNPEKGDEKLWNSRLKRWKKRRSNSP